jgi:hypothetical protein
MLPKTAVRYRVKSTSFWEKLPIFGHFSPTIPTVPQPRQPPPPHHMTWPEWTLYNFTDANLDNKKDEITSENFHKTTPKKMLVSKLKFFHTWLDTPRFSSQNKKKLSFCCQRHCSVEYSGMYFFIFDVRHTFIALAKESSEYLENAIFIFWGMSS